MRLVVMGVSGCGKSSLGAALARALALPFTDADDLHPAANRAKMAAGQPLTDQHRWPWLQAVGAVLAADAGVVACSALRRTYRDRLRAAASPYPGESAARIIEIMANDFAAATPLVDKSKITELAWEFGPDREPLVD
jgi:carbohydrate kinase (thermoresistant glucokinase family)